MLLTGDGLPPARMDDVLCGDGINRFVLLLQDAALLQALRPETLPAAMLALLRRLDVQVLLLSQATPEQGLPEVRRVSETASLIADWLQTNAVNPEWVGTQIPPDNRITRADWWQQIHKPSKKLTAKVWKNPYIKSASNCAACHRGAPNGQYSAKTVLIPS
jgi:hypothetical protein